MADAKKIVNKILRLLDQQQGETDEDTAELAIQYAEAVERTNERLERCVALLRQGLRTEAIHQAQIAPSVLVQALNLQFNQFGRWTGLCRSHRLTTPGKINETAIIELDEALPVHQKLDDLLRRHRRLALGRANMASRIKILRRLTQADPENPIWGQDLETFERHRQKQIPDEAIKASRRHDLTTLQKLVDECAKPWLVNPSAQLRQVLAKTLAKELAYRARQQLESLTQQLQESLDHDDETDMQAALSEWTKATSRLQGDNADIDTQLEQEVRQRLTQLRNNKDAQAAWESSLNAMEHVLNEQQPMETVERCWSELLKHERAIPPALQRQYEARCAQTATTSNRHFQLMMTATLGVLIIIGGITAMVIYTTQAKHELEQWQAQISQSVNEQQWDNAQQLLTELQNQNPNLLNQPIFQGLSDKVKQGQLAEENRRVQLGQAINDVQSAGVDVPNMHALTQAERLAKTPDEKTQVQQLRSTITQAKLAQQAHRDRQFSQQLSVLQTQYANWRDRNPQSPEDFKELGALEHDLGQLTAQNGISDFIQSAAQPLVQTIRTQLTNHRQALAYQQQIDIALNAIAQDYRDPDKLFDAQKQFVTQFPQHPLSQDFKDVAKTAKAIKAIVAWNELVATMPVLRVKQSQIADTRLVTINKFLHDYPQITSIQTYQDYLKRASQVLGRIEASAGQPDQLQNLFQSKLLDSVWAYKTTDGASYYTKTNKTPEKIGLGRIRITFATNANQMLGLTAEATKNFLPTELLSKDQSPQLSPQSMFVNEAKLLIQDPIQNWETADIELLRRVLADSKIDPILRAALATRFANLAAEQCWPLPVELSQANIILSNIDTNVAWMSPDDASVTTAREQITATLKKLPTFQDPLEMLEQNINAIKQQMVARTIVGMIWRNDKGQPTIQPALPATGSHRYQVILSRGNAGELINLAHTKDASVTMDTDLARIPMGTLVYQLASIPAGE